MSREADTGDNAILNLIQMRLDLPTVVSPTVPLFHFFGVPNVQV